MKILRENRLQNMRNNEFSKVKNSLLELEKDFKGLKDKELKDGEEKIKREMKNYFTSQLLCLKMIWISLKNKKWRK